MTQTAGSAASECSEFCRACKKVIEAAASGELSRKEAAYAIAGWLALDSIRQDSRFCDIAILASELELPDKHISDNPRDKWRELVLLIKNSC
jgi:hypothetical protein